MGLVFIGQFISIYETTTIFLNNLHENIQKIRDNTLLYLSYIHTDPLEFFRVDYTRL